MFTIKVLSLVLTVAFITGQQISVSDQCIQCFCHGVSGCYEIKKCASYSINRSYWELAGSHTIFDDDPSDEESYQRCMDNDNCIRDTIRSYVQERQKDCDCNGVIDCKDFAAIHFMGENCYGQMNRYRLMRLENCFNRRRTGERITMGQSRCYRV